MNAAILFFAFFSVGFAQEEGTVALFRNGLPVSLSSGIVQVYHQSQWKGVCSQTSFGNNEADVICRQLGYEGSQSYSTASEQQFGSINQANVTNLDCLSSYYQTMFQCSFDLGSCDVGQAVTVECSDTRVWDSAYSGQVRLSGGSYTSQGRVQIYCNDDWGEVCYSSFGSTETDVVCKQLGYETGTASSTTKSVNRQIWLDDVDCFSSYSCLSSCQSCPSDDTTRTCSTGGVAYVNCEVTADTDNYNAASFCDFATALALLGIIIGVVVACCVLSIVIALIPFCICCCLGVGIGAAFSR